MHVRHRRDLRMERTMIKIELLARSEPALRVSDKNFIILSLFLTLERRSTTSYGQFIKRYRIELHERRNMYVLSRVFQVHSSLQICDYSIVEIFSSALSTL